MTPTQTDDTDDEPHLTTTFDSLTAADGSATADSDHFSMLYEARDGFTPTVNVAACTCGPEVWVGVDLDADSRHAGAMAHFTLEGARDLRAQLDDALEIAAAATDD